MFVFAFLKLTLLSISFLLEFNADMQRQGRHVILLCDNAPSHKHNPADYPNIRIEFFAPNLTAWIQPMDSGIIRCFKSHYRRRFTRMAIRRDDEGVKQIYKINQLEAMQLAEAAWDAVSPDIIANCWRHTGILPPPPIPLPSPPITAEHETLDDEVAAHPRMLDPEFLRMMDSLTLDGPTEDECSDEDIAGRANDSTGRLD